MGRRSLARGFDPVEGALPWIARTGAETYLLTDDGLTRLMRIWLANRGVWEALPTASVRAAAQARQVRGTPPL
jgi:hypothetical protein